MHEKNYKRDTGNPGLLEKISYASIDQLKNMIRYISIMETSTNEKELCIIADIKTALGLYDKDVDNRVVTPRQKQAIVEHLVNDKTQEEVSDLMQISQQGVSLLIQSGLKRIKKYLVEGEVNWIPWSDKEREDLMKLYPIYGPDKTSDMLNKPKAKVISMYHALKNRGDRNGVNS